jgi:hypothetical protein
MTDEYEAMKPKLFTEEGQRVFLQIRDRVHRLIGEAGAVRMDAAIAKSTGDSWLMLACVDRLVELEEISDVGHNDLIPTQFRIYTSWRNDIPRKL